MKAAAIIGVGFLAVRACSSLVNHDPAAVEITARMSDGQVQLVYRAPAGVQRLRWADVEPRVVKSVRPAVLKPMDDCGQIEAEEIVIRDEASCSQTARFAVDAKVLSLDGLAEPARPSNGGVMLSTRYFTATAAGHGLRWRFEPPVGGQVAIDGGIPATGSRTFEVAAADVERALRTLDAEASWRTLHAAHAVYLGR